MFIVYRHTPQQRGSPCFLFSLMAIVLTLILIATAPTAMARSNTIRYDDSRMAVVQTDKTQQVTDEAGYIPDAIVVSDEAAQASPATISLIDDDTPILRPNYIQAALEVNRLKFPIIRSLAIVIPSVTLVQRNGPLII